MQGKGKERVSGGRVRRGENKVTGVFGREAGARKCKGRVGKE